jgi:hypothetical protein
MRSFSEPIKSLESANSFKALTISIELLKKTSLAADQFFY